MKEYKELRELLELSIQQHSANQSDTLQRLINIETSITSIREDIVEIKEEQKRLKTDTDPLVEGKKAAFIAGKAILWVAGFIMAIGGAIKIFK